MIENLRIRKKLTQLGITALAVINGAMYLGCTNVEAQEDVQSLVSMSTVLTTDDKEEVVATATPVITEEPTKAPTPNPTLSSTAEPTATPDPYTLTDEEAIKMGTYIYENYVAKYALDSDSFAAHYPRLYGKDDMINYVCVLNQKYPSLYPNRDSACSYGDLTPLYSAFEMFIEGNDNHIDHVGKNKLFPFSLFMKEGRPEKVLLEELENDFAYISNNDVSNDEIYKYWGKVFKLVINADETFKDWDSFNLSLFYYTARSQLYYIAKNRKTYNDFDFFIPSEYVFANKKGVKLHAFDTLSMRNNVNRNAYSGLSNQEFDMYAGCLEEFIDKYYIDNNEDNYILRRAKGSN